MTYRTVEDVEAETYTTETFEWFRGRAGRSRTGSKPATRYCLPGLCALCHVDHFWDDNTGTLTFYGTEAAVATAHYLLTIIGRAIEAEHKLFKLNTAATGRRASSTFRRLMAVRVGQRLHALAAEKTPTATGSGWLVPVQDATRRRAFEAAFAPHSERARLKVDASDIDAARAGYRAGDSVPLNPGLGSDSTPATLHIKDERDV